MIVALAIAGLLAGIVCARVFTAKPARTPVHHVLRLGPGAATRSLAEVIEAMRAAALRVETRADGFDVIDVLDASGLTRVLVRVDDPQRVSAGALVCPDARGGTVVFAIALAFASLFGPVQLTLGDEVYDVDGTRDVHELTRELSRRQTARLQALLATRTP